MAAFLVVLGKLSLLGTLLTGLLLLVRPWLHSKRVCYYLWLLVLARLCLPVGISLPVPTLPEPAVNQTQVTLPHTSTPEHTFEMQIPAAEGETVLQAAPETPQAQAVGWLALMTDPMLWFVLWAGGVLVCLGRYGWGYSRFSALVRKTAAPAPQEAQQILEKCAPRRRIALVECPHVSTPMLLGVMHPTIVLPEGVALHQLGDILAHELTHARRHDLLYKWLTAAITSLHWFNPLMVVVRQEVARSCELACDEAVIRRLDGPGRRHYGETLLTLAAQAPRGIGILTTTLCEEKQQLKERLVLIMKGTNRRPAAFAATVALALLLTGCAAISGIAPHSSVPSEEDTLLDNPVLYEIGEGLTVAIPRDLSPQLLIEEPEEDEILFTVYEKRSFDLSPGAGWIFSLARWDQIRYESYLTADGSGVFPFAQKDGWYYVWLHPTDVQVMPPDPTAPVSTEEEYWIAWETLNRRLPQEVRPDFIARNGLQPYDDSMYFHDGTVWEGTHRYVHYHNETWEISMTLLLSQPVRQGEGGIWCVEGWVDNPYGNYYTVLPLNTGMTAADYYEKLQQQADEGHQPGLLDPVQAAAQWLQDYYEDSLTISMDHITLLEGEPAWNIYFRRMQPILSQPGTLQALTYENGQKTQVETYDLPLPDLPFWSKVWINVNAPASLNGKAVLYTATDGNELVFLEEGGLVGITREESTDWYAYAYPYNASPYQVMYDICQS